jgi:hypothetical protein
MLRHRLNSIKDVLKDEDEENTAILDDQGAALNPRSFELESN